MSLSERTFVATVTPRPTVQWFRFHALIVVQSTPSWSHGQEIPLSQCVISPPAPLSFEGDTHKLLCKQPTFLVTKQTPRIHVGTKTGKFQPGREWRCFDHLSRYQRHFICGMCKNLFKNTIKWSEATTSGRRCCFLKTCVDNCGLCKHSASQPARYLKAVVHVSSINASTNGFVWTIATFHMILSPIDVKSLLFNDSDVPSD